jgi:transposase
VARRLLQKQVDFKICGGPEVTGEIGKRQVHETVELQVRVLRVKMPDGCVRQVEPRWADTFSGPTLMLEALVLCWSRGTFFSAVARIACLSARHVIAMCYRNVEEAVSAATCSAVKRLAIDGTSRAKQHEYVTFAADAPRRAMTFVPEGNASAEALAGNLRSRHARTTRIEMIGINMSPAFIIKGIREWLPDTQVTFGNCHVLDHASEAVEKTRRTQQRIGPAIRGLRWALRNEFAGAKRQRSTHRWPK